MENIDIKPFSCMKDLLTLIESRCKAKGDAITDWNLEKLEFRLHGPLTNFHEEESKSNEPMT